MSIMGSYCKAYAARQLAEFPGWREKPIVNPAPADSDDPALEGRYLFLQENFVVTDGIFLDDQIVFDDVSDEWKRFCVEVLKFEIPHFEEIPRLGDEPVEEAPPAS